MIIPYSPLPDIKTKVVLAPLVPITFYNGKHEFSTFALVDSGASGAVISVGGSFRYHEIKNIKANIYDNEFMLNVSIIEGVSPYKCILGQADIFRKAKITFEGYKNQFEIVFRDFN